MKILIRKIETCDDCPYFKSDWMWCDAELKRIPEEISENEEIVIPKWCQIGRAHV